MTEPINLGGDMSKTIRGIGINDADYVVQERFGKERVWCPFYRKWKCMIERAYSSAYHKLRPTYAEVTVCEEWHLFSNFKRWMEQQDWKGKQLDKDLLVQGNKVYSPETCVFVTSNINTLLHTKNAITIRKYPLGVFKFGKRYRSQISHGNYPKYLGMFDSAEEAHRAWQSSKIEQICSVIPQQDLRLQIKLWEIVDRLKRDVENSEETKSLC